MEPRDTKNTVLDTASDGARQSQSGLSRRHFVQTGASLVAAGALLGKKAFASNRPLKIGLVSTQTGALAPFGEADAFVVGEVRSKIQGGILSGGTTRQIEILVRDSQSSSNRAAQVAADLIKSDRIDLMVVAGTPDNVNPVADQCEINQVPCVSNDAPWQAYYFGRGGTPTKGFDWTYHFFWGAETMSQVMTDIFTLAPTNKVVGLLLGNDNDGNLFSDTVKGCPPVFEGRGFKVFDPGRFLMNTTDFSAQIAAFKKANAEILYGNMPIPVFSTFWSQAAQQGYRPKIASINKALLMPSAVNSLGPLGKNLTSEVWWSNNHPFKSSLTGVTAGQLCESYETYMHRQWAQTLGFRHALFEVAIDVLKRARNPESSNSVIDAVRNTRLNTIVGPVQWLGAPPNEWTRNPVKNVCTTPMVAGQWVTGKKWPYEIAVIDSRRYPSVPVQRKMVEL